MNVHPEEAAFWEPKIDKKYLKLSGMHIDTEYGRLRVWYDDTGIYIDLHKTDTGDVCLVSMEKDIDGLRASIYGDFQTGIPTESRVFNNISSAFDIRNVLYYSEYT